MKRLSRKRKEEVKGTLTEKQKMFCEEYLIDLNGTQAAIRAGYSEKGADTTASYLLVNSKVKRYIQDLMDIRAEKLDITQEKVLAEWAKIAFSNIKDFVEGDNVITLIGDVSRMKAAAISSIKKITTKNQEGEIRTVVEYKMWDKVRALENIGRHIGFYEADNKQKPAPIVHDDIELSGLSKATRDMLFEIGIKKLEAGASKERQN